MTAEGFYTHRQTLGLKRAALARALGMAPRTIKAYEEGQSPIPLYVALAIGALLYSMPPAP